MSQKQKKQHRGELGELTSPRPGGFTRQLCSDPQGQPMATKMTYQTSRRGLSYFFLPTDKHNVFSTSLITLVVTIMTTKANFPYPPPSSDNFPTSQHHTKNLPTAFPDALTSNSACTAARRGGGVVARVGRRSASSQDKQSRSLIDLFIFGSKGNPNHWRIPH